MTGAGAIIAIVSAVFSYFFFIVEWIELNCYVKTKDYSIFDENENQFEKRFKEYYQTFNSFNFSDEQKK